jgi:hypothetical protein
MAEEKKKPRRIRLKSSSDVVRYMGWMARQVEVDAIPDEKAKTLTAIARVLLKAIETQTLEQLDERMKQLEQEGTDV